MNKYCNERNTRILYNWYVQLKDNAINLPELSSLETEVKSAFTGEYLYVGFKVVCFPGSETSEWKSLFFFV